MEDNSKILTWPGWQTVRLIGEGSYGKVYEIQRVEDENVFKAALKVIRIPKSDSELENLREEGMDEDSIHTYFGSIVKDIKAEYALMAKLRGCPNIVYYDDHMILEDKETMGWDILIKMELLKPFSSYVKAVGVSESMIRKCGIELCKALEACQAQQIIHRDIKPGNMFINDYGNIKLGDFGIARTLDHTSTMLTRTGTYPYMAPEIFHGQKAGFSADIYSVGMVLYRYMNNNIGPFEKSTKNRTTKSIQEAQDRRFAGEPLPYPRYGSPQMKDIVLKATNYDPAKRFRSPQEMRRALEQISENPIPYKDLAGSNWGQTVPVASSGMTGRIDPEIDKEAEERERLKKERIEQERREKEYRAWLRQEEERKKRLQEEEEENRRRTGIAVIGGLAVILLIFVGIFLYLSSGGDGGKVSSDSSKGKADSNMASGAGSEPQLLVDSTVILLGDTMPVRFYDGENTYAYDEDLSFYSQPNTVEIRSDSNGYRNYIVASAVGQTTVTGTMDNLDLSRDIYVLDPDAATNSVLCDTEKIVFSVTSSGAGAANIELTVDGKSGEDLEARIYTNAGEDLSNDVWVTAEAEWDDNTLKATVSNYLSPEKRGELVVVFTEKGDPSSLIGFKQIPIEIG